MPWWGYIPSNNGKNIQYKNTWITYKHVFELIIPKWQFPGTISVGWCWVCVEALHLRAREPTHHSASDRRHLAKSRAADGGDPTEAGTGTDFGRNWAKCQKLNVGKSHYRKSKNKWEMNERQPPKNPIPIKCGTKMTCFWSVCGHLQSHTPLPYQVCTSACRSSVADTLVWNLPKSTQCQPPF